jgi:hypothetical protein
VAAAVAVPRVDHQPHETGAGVLGPVREDPRDLVLGVERPLDRLDEQAGLALEEVHDERGVDARVAGDRPHRRAVVAVLGELAPGGVDDRVTRAGVPRPAACPGHDRSLTDEFNTVKSTVLK